MKTRLGLNANISSFLAEISSLQDQCESFTLSLSSSREEHGERYKYVSDLFDFLTLWVSFLNILISYYRSPPQMSSFSIWYHRHTYHIF